MIVIPEELIVQVKRGNVLLFIGERVLRDAQGVPVMDQIALDLAVLKFDNPDKWSIAEASQGYQDTNGRQALIQYLRDRLEEPGNESQAAYRLIASLAGCKVMATTCMDRSLERAFDAAGRPLDVIIGRTDLPFQDERKTRLYKLRGSIERPESLVLTEDDYDKFFDDDESLSVVLQGLLATKTILFVGYSLDDPDFKRLYQKATSSLDNLARRSYAFATSTSPSIARWCQRHNVELIEINAETFLEALVEQLQQESQAVAAAGPGQAAATGAPAIALPQRPYKLLDAYGTGDAGIFFGREQETQLLTARVHAHRVVLLYGASGTGKTSLWLAGVVPRLEGASTPYLTAYVRLRGTADPAEAVRTAVRRSLAAAYAGQPTAPSPGATRPDEATLGAAAPARLADFVADSAKATGQSLVLFLDQFEEFFTQYGPEVRRAFIAELGEIYDATSLPVKLVFSLREDWLASMNELTDRLPGVFQRRPALAPLDTPASPARHHGARSLRSA